MQIYSTIEQIDCYLKGVFTKQDMQRLNIPSEHIELMIGESTFSISDHVHLSMPYKTARSNPRTPITIMQLGMIKYLVKYFSQPTLQYYTGLTRSWLSSIKSGDYASEVKPIECCLLDLVTILKPDEFAKEVLYTKRSVVRHIYLAGVTDIDKIATLMHVNIKTAQRWINGN